MKGARIARMATIATIRYPAAKRGLISAMRAHKRSMASMGTFHGKGSPEHAPERRRRLASGEVLEAQIVGCIVGKAFQIGFVCKCIFGVGNESPGRRIHECLLNFR